MIVLLTLRNRIYLPSSCKCERTNYSILKNTLNVTVMCCQSLDSTAQKKDINLIKSNLLPIPVDEQENEPAVIKKAHQFVSFNIGDSQLLDIMNFLGGATKLDFFSKLTRLMRQKGFSRKNGSIAKRN